MAHYPAARVLLYRHDLARAHDPGAQLAGHPDGPERIAAIETALAARDWLGAEVREAPAASESELELVHSPAHVGRIRALAQAGGGALDAETLVSPDSFEAARHAAGAALALVRALAAGEDEAGLALTRPAGHHAEPERAMGFCLFDNVALAAELARRELGVERVLIVDWDVHHGNGTAEIFRRRSDVLVASIHQAGLFPNTGPAGDAGSGAGLGYTINAPVPPGSDEEVWLSVLEHVVLAAGLEFAPDLVLISAGFDAHARDPLGGCKLEAASFHQMACQVRDLARGCGAPVGAVLEGGYDPAALAESVLATVAALGGEGRSESIAPEFAVTPRIAAHVGHFWTL